MKTVFRFEYRNSTGPQAMSSIVLSCVPLLVLISLATGSTELRAQQLKPETVHEFECYAQSAEARGEARKVFLLADSDSALNAQLQRGQKAQTVAGNGANPHPIAGGQIYDWIGSIFIPGASLEKTVAMLQDYDHRSQYFSETISASKLLRRTGETRFRYTMRLKEPAVIDVESDVTWERVDPHRWRCRSYSTEVHEVGKDHRYLQRLYSYWRFAETDKGVYAEGETVTLSGEFGSFMRGLGSMMGINPEKSLKHSLESMRETMLKPGLQVPPLPSGLLPCGEPFRPGGCAAASAK